MHAEEHELRAERERESVRVIEGFFRRDEKKEQAQVLLDQACAIIRDFGGEIEEAADELHDEGFRDERSTRAKSTDEIQSGIDGNTVEDFIVDTATGIITPVVYKDSAEEAGDMQGDAATEETAEQAAGESKQGDATTEQASEDKHADAAAEETAEQATDVSMQGSDPAESAQTKKAELSEETQAQQPEAQAQQPQNPGETGAAGKIYKWVFFLVGICIALAAFYYWPR